MIPVGKPIILRETLKSVATQFIDFSTSLKDLKHAIQTALTMRIQSSSLDFWLVFWGCTQGRYLHPPPPLLLLSFVGWSYFQVQLLSVVSELLEIPSW